MRFGALTLSVLIVFCGQVFANSNFPLNPDEKMTPGSLCTHPDAHRYPERIAYCNRDVSKAEKWAVINAYNDAGWRIDKRDRQQFKIDHLIPLCVGGSNEKDNLWPQHESVYVITDAMEGIACDKMAKGRLLQERAVELILRAKHHLEEAPEIQAELEAL
jgi:hypothetical protein